MSGKQIIVPMTEEFIRMNDGDRIIELAFKAAEDSRLVLPYDIRSEGSRVRIFIEVLR